MPELIRCRDECGATVPEDRIEGAGWEYLEIQKAYRCTACWNQLRAASGQVGMGSGAVVDLPPDSRGAIRKETASGITPPSVKA